MKRSRIFTTYVVAIVAQVFAFDVSGESATLDTIIRQHKKKTYDHRNRWIYVKLRHIERVEPQDAEQNSVKEARQSISIVLDLNSSQMRIDSSQQHPNPNSIQLLTSSEGTTYYSSKTKLKGDKVDEMVTIADSLATMCRLLTWPANVSYSVVESRNRINIDLGGRPVKLHFDAKENLLLSAEVKDRNLGRFGSFEFSDFSWRQGIRFPRVWDYSDDSAKRRGTFQVESMFLLIDLDDSCFTTKGMTKDLQEYIRKAIRSSNMKRLSEIHLTDAQKKEISDGLAQIQKKIADIEKRYAEEPEKLRKASKALMDEWKLRLQEIQTGGKSSVLPQK